MMTRLAGVASAICIGPLKRVIAWLRSKWNPPRNLMVEEYAQMSTTDYRTLLQESHTPTTLTVESMQRARALLERNANEAIFNDHSAAYLERLLNPTIVYNGITREYECEQPRPRTAVIGWSQTYRSDVPAVQVPSAGHLGASGPEVSRSREAPGSDDHYPVWRPRQRDDQGEDAQASRDRAAAEEWFRLHGSVPAQQQMGYIGGPTVWHIQGDAGQAGRGTDAGAVSSST